MLVIHLGVTDVPYAVRVPPELKRVAVRTQRGGGKPGKARVIRATPTGGQSTGDVATILEDKYHVIELFAEELGADVIRNAIEHSAAGAIESLLSGAPAQGLTLTAEAFDEMRGAFVLFIDQQELDGIVPGVPTAASLKGVNHSFKHPYAKGNPQRPSFKDTGLYRDSFMAWSD